jgi:hypothetical protein
MQITVHGGLDEEKVGKGKRGMETGVGLVW